MNWNTLILEAVTEAKRRVAHLVGTNEGGRSHGIGAGGDTTRKIDKAAEEFRTANFLDPAEKIYRQNLAEALEILRSPSRTRGRLTEFRGRFKEGPATDQDIFRFAW